MASQAVMLFLERARSRDPRFALTTDNATAVAQLCTGLDGLPLALELAAARIKLFTPEEMLLRLQNRFAWLTSGPQDAPDRQRTLHATLEWSYNLLEPDEQRLFARLAVFEGGWTLDSAEAVCNLAGHDSLDVLGLYPRSWIRIWSNPICRTPMLAASECWRPSVSMRERNSYRRVKRRACRMPISLTSSDWSRRPGPSPRSSTSSGKWHSGSRWTIAISAQRSTGRGRAELPRAVWSSPPHLHGSGCFSCTIARDDTGYTPSRRRLDPRQHRPVRYHLTVQGAWLRFRETM